MADPELEEIRARRMAEMQQQMGGKNRNDEEKIRQQQEERTNSILSQILTQGARARLNSIAMVKPEKGKMVESLLIRMATTGQIPGKVDENQLKDLLSQVSSQTERKTTVKFDRRRLNLDDDDDDY
ncbi:programmed cell death protein 5-like [Anneissia japonica]|uniref:programmed cell death protein 5-like n=1 Tax=Anneissia japonica TaxID=1529436 RepID=UPI001425ADA6|nr:programmed cell death protein 5-like [Anneissia japonica]